MADTCQVVSGRQIQNDLCIRMNLQERRRNSIRFRTFHCLCNNRRFIFTPSHQDGIPGFHHGRNSHSNYTCRNIIHWSKSTSRFFSGSTFQQHQAGTRTGSRTGCIEHDITWRTDSQQNVVETTYQLYLLFVSTAEIKNRIFRHGTVRSINIFRSNIDMVE